MGVYESHGIRELKGVKWKFHTGAPVISSPALSNGAILVGSVDTFFYSIDKETGQQKWKFETGGSLVSSAVVDDSVVYFGSYDGKFYSLDERTGELRWKFAMEYERRFEAKHLHNHDPKEQTLPDAWDFFMSSPAVSNGRVYFGSGDKNIHAVNAKSGVLKWKFPTGMSYMDHRRSRQIRSIAEVRTAICMPWYALH